MMQNYKNKENKCLHHFTLSNQAFRCNRLINQGFLSFFILDNYT
jgi:hypothetical protein